MHLVGSNLRDQYLGIFYKKTHFRLEKIQSFWLIFFPHTNRQITSCPNIEPGSINIITCEGSNEKSRHDAEKFHRSEESIQRLAESTKSMSVTTKLLCIANRKNFSDEEMLIQNDLTSQQIH